jgi:tetratricopeptide (TPR) repeat protein
VGQALPKVEDPAVAPVPGSSNSFKSGLTAYRQQDYVNAIRLFSSLSKPPSKKRGPIEREEYVQANFLKGLALLKVGHMSEAVSAFQNVLEYEKYYPLANMNLGICYVELKQYAKAHQAFEAVVRDQSFIEPAVFDDVMQRTKYFWALAWTRLYKNATNLDKQNFYRQQAVLKWKDYEVWFSKNEKYKSENLKAENYLKSLSSL